MYRSVAVSFLCVLGCLPIAVAECNIGEYAQGEICTACPTAYPYSISNADSINDCYLITRPGEYVDAAGAAPVKCPANHYCPGNQLVFYNPESRRYVIVDYIKSTGTQYIDTGIILGSDIDTELVFAAGNIPDRNDALFGASNNNFHYWLNGFGNRMYVRYNTYAPIVEYRDVITPDKKSILEIKSGDWIFDGKSIYTNSGTFDVGISGYLFARNVSDDKNIWPHTTLKIYSFTQWRDDKKVIDLIPVYDSVRDECGMLDLVTGNFLGNIGTGKFKCDTQFNDNVDLTGMASCALATDNGAPYSPAGSDTVQDCGYILHLGPDRKLYLHSDKRTSPSLAVLVKNRVFYADTSPAAHGVLRTEYNGRKLSVYNMDADD